MSESHTDVREQLQRFLARYDAGKIDSIAIVAIGSGELASAYCGDSMHIVYGLDALKHAILSDE